MPQPRQSTRKKQSSSGSQKKSSAGAQKSTSASRSRSSSSSARSAKDSAKDNAGVRDQLARFLDPREVVVLTRERVQEAVDDAVERGRMTRQDATALVAALFERGRSQTDDLISQIEGIVTGTPTRIVREVDRARRVAGMGSGFPISGYDDLTAAEVGDRLGELSPPELRKVRDYERRNANRKSVLQNIERKLG
jgi:polyhydroxyalkanoate synthesis regulator phasin